MIRNRESKYIIAIMLKRAYKDFAQAFAVNIIELDFVAAHRMLAPWLMNSITPEQLRRLIHKEVQEVAEANEIEGEYHPGSYEIDSNICTLQDLKETPSYRDARQIAEQVNEENYRQWMVIQFQPTQQEQEELDIDAWLDWWMIVVEVEGELRMGYFEIEDPD